jgi:hypothetical protein
LAANGIPLTDLLYWTKPIPFEQVVNNADLKDTATVTPDKNCFAVVDVYNSGTVNSSYNILGTSEKLFNPAPAFTIKFESKV